MTMRKEIIERAMSFPLEDIIARYQRDHKVSAEVAREHERELRRYLAVCAANPSTAYGMSGPVDELWHTFIIFTSEYARFCQLVAGRFLHHFPRVDRADAKLEDTDDSDYRRFLADYEILFGEPAPRQIWPQPTADFEILGVLDVPVATDVSPLVFEILA